jgi:magnesium transporter
LIQLIEGIDEQKAKDILESLNKDDKDDISWLKQYEENEAGAFMQTELFCAYEDESILQARENLIKQKQQNQLENIYGLFVKDRNDALIATIALEDLFIANYDMKLSEIIESGDFSPLSVTSRSDIQDVVKIFSDYDLPVIPVVEYKNRLVGRITSDDVYDIINDSATEQIYNLAGVGDSNDYHDFYPIFKDRLLWLFINLGTAILASLVISLFDATLEQIIALAILMPIVASMGGNAGTQTVTVVVRQLALGLIKFENAKNVLKKEVLLAFLNGIVFAVAIGIISYFWFDDIKLSIVIAAAMIVNIITAGLFGASVPFILKKINVDPAIGSSVIITTITDVIGFLSFLMLAEAFLI